MKREITLVLFVFVVFRLFADYDDDLQLRRLLIDIPGFCETQDSSLPEKYVSAGEYISTVKLIILGVEKIEVVLNAKEYYDDYCKAIKEYDNSVSHKLTFHDFYMWTDNYVQTNRGKYPKPQ
ncbi:MAG TPA: hypothetical protein GX710_08880 [Clostridiales bacterium]|nr:hypothetical protein [Clostridiales bacterium]